MAIATQSKAAMTHAPVIPANQSTNGIHSMGCEVMSLVDRSISYPCDPTQIRCMWSKRLHPEARLEPLVLYKRGDPSKSCFCWSPTFRSSNFHSAKSRSRPNLTTNALTPLGPPGRLPSARAEP